MRIAKLDSPLAGSFSSRHVILILFSDVEETSTNEPLWPAIQTHPFDLRSPFELIFSTHYTRTSCCLYY